VYDLFKIVFIIISDYESICSSRFGSQDLTKWRNITTGAAGHEKVSLFELHVTLIYIEVISDP